jgi:hypothetical protein
MFFCTQITISNIIKPISEAKIQAILLSLENGLSPQRNQPEVPSQQV